MFDFFDPNDEELKKSLLAKTGLTPGLPMPQVPSPMPENLAGNGDKLDPAIVDYLTKNAQPAAPATPGSNFGPGGAVAVGLSGLGDALSTAAGRPTTHAKDTMQTLQGIPEQAMKQHEMGRSIQTEHEQDDPASPTSNAQRALLTKMGIDAKDVDGLSYTQMQPMAAIAEKAYGVDATTKERLLAAQIAADARRDSAQLMAQGRNFTMGMRQDQYKQNQWTKFQKENDPMNAGSRTVIGMLGRANLQADRALNLLKNNKTLTNADLGNVTADIAGIFQSGAPTDMGMKHQNYDTLQSKIAGILQFASGKPQDAVSPEIRQKLIASLGDLKNTNLQIIKSHNDQLEKRNKWLLSDHPDEWKEFRGGLEGLGAETPPPDGSGKGQPDQNGYVVGQQYKMKDGAMATYEGNGEFE